MTTAGWLEWLTGTFRDSTGCKQYYKKKKYLVLFVCVSSHFFWHQPGPQRRRVKQALRRYFSPSFQGLSLGWWVSSTHQYRTVSLHLWVRPGVYSAPPYGSECLTKSAERRETKHEQTDSNRNSRRGPTYTARGSSTQGTSAWGLSWGGGILLWEKKLESRCQKGWRLA